MPTTAERIWHKENVSREQLPSPFSILFGAFQVLDSRIRDADELGNSMVAVHEGTTGNASYIDIGFGSDKGQFAGVHRFSVVRPQQPSRIDGWHDIVAENNDGGNDEFETVEIHFSCVTCNPLVDVPLNPTGMLFRFHMFYADWLLRESVSRMQGFVRGWA